MARSPVFRRRSIAPILAFGVLGALLTWPRRATTFVCSPSGRVAARQPQVVCRGASGTVPKPTSDTKDVVADPPKQDIDDAVLQMAMAMAEEEESPKVAAPKQEFDWNLVITVLLVSVIIYSFGSAVISITTGRVQDRTGGDFTAYDFFDNIFAFKEWNLEYSLGFDPVKLFNNVFKKS